MPTKNKMRPLYESYWRIYFAELDRLMAIEARKVHGAWLGARSITAHFCIDGALSYFNRGEFSVKHRSTMKTVHAMFDSLAAPMSWSNPVFPPEHSFGPVYAGGVNIVTGKIEHHDLPIHFARMVWMQNTPNRFSDDAAIERATKNYANPPEFEVFDGPMPTSPDTSTLN